MKEAPLSEALAVVLSRLDAGAYIRFKHGGLIIDGAFIGEDLERALSEVFAFCGNQNPPLVGTAEREPE